MYLYRMEDGSIFPTTAVAVQTNLNYFPIMTNFIVTYKNILQNCSYFVQDIDTETRNFQQF
jgi:hypothetical protein